MSAVLFRVLATGFAGGFGFAGIYSATRHRRLETVAYVVACVSVFVMVTQ